MSDAGMAPAPADMSDDDQTDAGAPDAGGDDSPMVLCTIMKNPDGSYMLTMGDEDDSGAGADMPADGSAPPAPGGDMGKPEPQTFTDPGALLKAVLDVLQKDQEESGGSAQSHFESGFSGDNAPTPKKAMPPKS